MDITRVLRANIIINDLYPDDQLTGLSSIRTLSHKRNYFENNAKHEVEKQERRSKRRRKRRRMNNSHSS